MNPLEQEIEAITLSISVLERYRAELICKRNHELIEQVKQEMQAHHAKQHH